MRLGANGAAEPNHFTARVAGQRYQGTQTVYELAVLGGRLEALELGTSARAIRSAATSTSCCRPRCAGPIRRARTRRWNPSARLSSVAEYCSVCMNYVLRNALSAGRNRPILQQQAANADQGVTLMLLLKSLCGVLAGVAALGLTVAPAAAQSNYPTRAVRVIVPFAPGGGTDIFTRVAAQKLSERLGQQFYVENIVGAGGNTGTAQAARATPDGYTVLFAFGSFVTNPSLYAKVPYDPRKDFDPVTNAVSTTTALMINPSLPVKTAKDLVELIRANPGKYSYAHGGFGTQLHLTGEQFRMSLGLDLVHIPYSGAGPSTAAVVAGHTPMGFASAAAVTPHIKDGKLRALAVTSKTRFPSLPDVPTMVEAGLPDIAGDTWVGVLVPAGTPKSIITLLHRELVEIIAQPDMRTRLATLGYEPLANTPEQFAEQIKAELETWRKIIEAANIKVQ